MGHLAICNNPTFLNIIKTGYISVKFSIGVHQVKTIADIMSTFLCIKVGDYIFPWIINSGKDKGIGFKYVFKCGDEPIYIQGDDYPFKIKEQNEYHSYYNPVSENEALDLFRNKLLWNANGKKSLGRSRGITSQTPDEGNLLLELLNNKNPLGVNVEQLRPELQINHTEPVTLNIDHNQINDDFINVVSVNAEFIQRAFTSFNRKYNVVKVVLTGNGNERGGPIRINDVHWIAYEYNELNQIVFIVKC